MKFEEALKAMREGKKVRIKDEDFCFKIVQGHLIALFDNKLQADITSIDDYSILSEDWEIVDESI